MECFLEKSALIDKIAGRRLKEAGIYLAVDLVYYDYIKDLKNNMPDSMLELVTGLEEMKPLLIEVILRASNEVPREP
ncbi:MAG: hypothetical protein ACD_16C00248G0023 [uncultured bacterium]|nr:MAG: hypothetical protein ACD_16C00248G0023 [uncultured bacterium]OFW68534.1 MAG: hypothetical protein A2X70_02305 [Alphaproteobacteria bacterium GWC2_42_16]OFW73151.1 MAG: hypothetical protein A2Z80_00960 [Alphaproteobacteria bacterium GWA2_41_27]OFW81699.1 MAG: hypothetical protein A3E50_01875 [Alphaproteobacteria bacterium RIFCSPHIGHO2_12_FULL_42_100]OFW86417.1 MAG: hypothetical protein A2W06_05795 [Alphaproteobacteria bacterium RBG_16_42_14]OFW90599.1 MAG: hypothetical protein A3C41_002